MIEHESPLTEAELEDLETGPPPVATDVTVAFTTHGRAGFEITFSSGKLKLAVDYLVATDKMLAGSNSSIEDATIKWNGFTVWTYSYTVTRIHLYAYDRVAMGRFMTNYAVAHYPEEGLEDGGA